MQSEKSHSDPALISYEVLEEMKSLRDERNIAGMARYGINVQNALGVSMKWMRERAKTLPKDNRLAVELWSTGIHEAMILASVVAVPRTFEKDVALKWVEDFDSWDLCDQCCSNLFSRTPYARDLVGPWCAEDKEFVKRAGFVMIAALAVKDKRSDPLTFAQYFELIERESTDPRNNVKKAVNWALRQIGKRDYECLLLAIPVAERLASSEDKIARWIGKDAYRELTAPIVQTRVMNKKLDKRYR